MYLCRQITMEVLLNLKKNVANVIIQEHSMKRLAIAGCSLCGLWVLVWRRNSLRLRSDSPLPVNIIRSYWAPGQPKNAKLL